mgnify:FL=1|tara:strand:- start:688 stop:2091 length:1404 start_codon:yes stop_codon:yes gene_type:complete
MLKYFDDILGKDLSFGVLFEFLFYFSVRITPDALPLAVLLSSIMTFGNLGENNELVAIKSAGNSLLRTLLPLFMVSVLITFFAFYSNNNFVPKANLKALSLLYDIKRKKPSMDLKEGQFYSGIPGYTIKAKEKITDELLKDVMIYDHVTYQGNNRVILSDSAYMYSILDNRYLVFELHNGSSYTEIPVETSRVKYINQFYRNNFSFMKLIFDMSSFDLQRTKEELFAGDYRMKNTKELSNTIDSLEFNKSKQKYIMLKNSTSFYDFHMKDKFMLPDGVVKIRSEFKEDDLVKDYFTNNKELIDLEDSFYTSVNNSIVLDKNIYSRALNSARNIKTNLSINSARIKSQKFEINKNEIELDKKFAQAFACISMFIIGAPLGSLIKRGGIGVPVIISIVFYIVYYVLNILGIKWAREDIISPELAAWLSNLILFPIGLFFLYHSRKDSRIFEIDIVEYFRSKFSKNKKTD